MVNVSPSSSTTSAMTEAEFNSAFYGENERCRKISLLPPNRPAYFEREAQKVSFSGEKIEILIQELGSDLYYFRARYYDAELGRFIGRDPLGHVDGMSLYRAYFVQGGVDPSGKWNLRNSDWGTTFGTSQWNDVGDPNVDTFTMGDPVALPFIGPPAGEILSCPSTCTQISYNDTESWEDGPGTPYEVTTYHYYDAQSRLEINRVWDGYYNVKMWRETVVCNCEGTCITDTREQAIEIAGGTETRTTQYQEWF